MAVVQWPAERVACWRRPVSGAARWPRMGRGRSQPRRRSRLAVSRCGGGTMPAVAFCPSAPAAGACSGLVRFGRTHGPPPRAAAPASVAETRLPGPIRAARGGGSYRRTFRCEDGPGAGIACVVGDEAASPVLCKQGAGRCIELCPHVGPGRGGSNSPIRFRTVATLHCGASDRHSEGVTYRTTDDAMPVRPTPVDSAPRLSRESQSATFTFTCSGSVRNGIQT